MSNDFYTQTGYPANSGDGRAVDMRAELLALQAAFDKMPSLSASAGKLVLVNAAGTGLTVSPIGTYQNNVAWTPAISCVTPGNLTVAYSTQVGSIARIGQLIKLSFSIITSTFTHTTASGTFLITGFPTIEAGAFTPMIGGGLYFRGITKASYTQFSPGIIGAFVEIFASGSAQTNVALVITDFPTGGTVVLNGTIWYEGAT